MVMKTPGNETEGFKSLLSDRRNLPPLANKKKRQKLPNVIIFKCTKPGDQMMSSQSAG
jgi:hypothetical protein